MLKHHLEKYRLQFRSHLPTADSDSAASHHTHLAQLKLPSSSIYRSHHFRYRVKSIDIVRQKAR
jgi:hypothetical protein